MTSENVFPSIAKFAADVRRALAHLSADQIAELTGDLEANITASVADGAPIPDVTAYVNELLSAAGLETPTKHPRRSFGRALHIVNEQLRGIAPMLWFLRAAGLTMVLAGVTSERPAVSGHSVFPAVYDRVGLGVGVFAFLLVASVRLGRREQRIPILVHAAIAVVLGGLGALTLRDEIRWSNSYAMSQRNPCYELGYDSRGVVRMPDTPVPNLVGMNFTESDKAIIDWGRGLVILSATVMPADADLSEAIITEQQPMVLDDSGACPYLSIPVRLDSPSRYTPPMTTAPSPESMTTVLPSTTTSTVSATTSPTLPTPTTAPSVGPVPTVALKNTPTTGVVGEVFGGSTLPNSLTVRTTTSVVVSPTTAVPVR